jgi:hypothetical protein
MSAQVMESMHYHLYFAGMTDAFCVTETRDKHHACRVDVTRAFERDVGRPDLRRIHTPSMPDRRTLAAHVLFTRGNHVESWHTIA